MTLKLPDWAIYGAVTGALLLVSLTGRERADAPEAPPPPAGTEGALIGSPLKIDRTIAIDPAEGPGAPQPATAFSLSDSGRWVTARRFVKGCKKAAILMGGGQALEAKVVEPAHGETALLVSDGASTALPLAPAASVTPGERGYHLGYPKGRPGEIATRLMGKSERVTQGHGRTREPVLVWALVGRTKGLAGSLAGLDGAPVLDSEGRVVGVTLQESRRRGRLYSTTPEALVKAAPQAGREAATGEPITPDNYGRAADALRRDVRVAEVRCL